VVLLIIPSITTRNSFLRKAVAIHLCLQKFLRNVGRYTLKYEIRNTWIISESKLFNLNNHMVSFRHQPLKTQGKTPQYSPNRRMGGPQSMSAFWK